MAILWGLLGLQGLLCPPRHRAVSRDMSWARRSSLACAPLTLT